MLQWVIFDEADFSYVRACVLLACPDWRARVCSCGILLEARLNMWLCFSLGDVTEVLMSMERWFALVSSLSSVQEGLGANVAVGGLRRGRPQLRACVQLACACARVGSLCASTLSLADATEVVSPERGLPLVPSLSVVRK